MKPVDYTELHCCSSFSFLRGASAPDELVQTAQALGYRGLALTDECSLAGVVRGWDARRELADPGFRYLIGAELPLADGPRLLLIAENLEGYQTLSRLITLARQDTPKGQYRLRAEDLPALPGLSLIWAPGMALDEDHGRCLRERFDRVWIAYARLRLADDRTRFDRTRLLARRLGLKPVAVGEVHHHLRERGALQDVVTALRQGQPVSRCGRQLFPNHERHLRPLAELATLYPAAWLRETQVIAERSHFELGALRYQYPAELVPEGETATTHLRRLTEAGLQQRWPQGVPEAVRRDVEKELKLIAEMAYESFFLTVEDLVREARRRGILCQGRGSAANSVVCYALGITEVSPDFTGLLFERFISKERGEPPDIDVDFEHQRREEIIQYLYDKYGRHRAALAATVIHWRPRSALRDVGKALDMPSEVIDQLARNHAWWDRPEAWPAHLQKLGVATDDPRVTKWLRLAQQLIGLPRHLSQHVGGFVIAEHQVADLVPVENAAMPDRSIIQWDKDDLESLGLLKVDVLALGMLTAIRRSFDALDAWGTPPGAAVNPPVDRHEHTDKPGFNRLRGGKVLPPYDVPPVGRHDHADKPGFNRLRGGKVLPPYDVPLVGRHDHADRPGFNKLRGGKVLPPYDVPPVGRHDHADRPRFNRLRGGKVLPPYDASLVGRHDHADHPPSRDTAAKHCRPTPHLFLPACGEKAFGDRGVTSSHSPACPHSVGGSGWQLADIPRNCKDTFAMLQRGESLGVFQVESRAQMNMLPRLKPKNLYDLAIQVAIVRPGPIQGGMVHPFLKARQGLELPDLPQREELRAVLERTHGVPIFQEQVMQICIVAAGFTPGEADQVRRSMAAWRHKGGLEHFRDRLMAGMAARDYPPEFAERIYQQILGFGSYGFPESHAASFALLTWFSSWLKCHHPAAFFCGLINSLPMGFYPLSMLVREAQRMEVEVRPVDVCHSDWDSHLEPDAEGRPAIRLGLRLVKGLSEAATRQLCEARQARPFDSLDDLAARSALKAPSLEALARADALRALSGHRHHAQWSALAATRHDDLFAAAGSSPDPVALPAPSEGAEIIADYASTGLSLRRHPVALLRQRLQAARVTPNARLQKLKDGQRVRVAGLAMFRQRPGSAKGTMFLTLEDETGVVNLIIRPALIEAQREAVVGAQFAIAEGRLQLQQGIVHVMAERLHDRSHWVGELPYLSRDFH
jgi:DNA polymerase III alpha subunit